MIKQFCEEMIAKFQADPTFHRKLIFSGKWVFALTSSVNKHNVHYWGTKKRTVYVRFQNPGKTPILVVWGTVELCGQTPAEKRWPVIDIVKFSTLNWYHTFDTMLTSSFSKMEHLITIVLTQGAFSTHNIARSMDWQKRTKRMTARSPDLTPCDYWLWSYLRSKVFPKDKMQHSIGELYKKSQKRLPVIRFLCTFLSFDKKIEKIDFMRVETTTKAFLKSDFCCLFVACGIVSLFIMYLM